MHIEAYVVSLQTDANTNFGSNSVTSVLVKMTLTLTRKQKSGFDIKSTFTSFLLWLCCICSASSIVRTSVSLQQSMPTLSSLSQAMRESPVLKKI